MEINVFAGLMFALLAGIFAGSFSFPMKFTTGWKWQHNWIVYVVWAMLIMPLIVALVTIPHLWYVYQCTDAATLLKVFLFGMAWGVGVICFGLGLDYLGVALGMSIMIGLMISLGSLLPLAIFHPEELTSPKGLDIMLASLIILGGIIICAISGSMRDRKKNETHEIKAKRSVFVTGLIIAVFAGLLSTLQNIGFVMGNPIQKVAVENGANPLNTGNAVWPVLMAGCLLSNVLYCGYLITKYREWNLFTTQKKWYWGAVAVSGIIWFFCMMFFGMAVANLGKLGPSIGWASFQTIAIITGNMVGLFTGEWKGSGKRPLLFNFLGILLLVIGIIVLAF